MLPISQTQPVPWQNPVVFRADAALPAQGAWDTPLELYVTYATNLTLSFTYDRGAVGGAFDFQIWYTIYSLAALAPAGAEEWVCQTAYAIGGVALGTTVQDRIQTDYMTFGEEGLATHGFVYGPLGFAAAIERIRIRARESADGITATPGNLQITGELTIV